ncbi:MAG: amidohydrolase family protein [Microbacteriaceae bacterium]|nr:amidohydrolase family protein [Microbacteriaceae bacterium]
MTTLVIESGTLIDGTGSPALHDVAVVVHDGTIVGVEPVGDGYRSREARVVDARTATLTPGLIDAHAHPAYSTDDDPAEWEASRRSPEGLRAWCLASLQAAGRAGVTTVRDVGSPTLVTVEVARTVADPASGAARLRAGGPAITTTGGHADFIGVAADDEAGLRARVRELHAAGVDHVKLMAAGGDMDPHTNRRAPQYRPDDVAALVEEAHGLGLHVVAHATCTTAIAMCVDAGVDTLAHCNWLGSEPGTIDYDPRIADRIVERGMFIDLDLPNSFADYTVRDGESFIVDAPHGAPRNRWQLHHDLRARGAHLFFSSDEFGRKLAHYPGRLAAVAEAGVPVEEVVQRATSVPAAAVDPGSGAGVIRAGAPADLALFAGDLTRDPAGLRECRGSWRSGVALLEVSG